MKTSLIIAVMITCFTAGMAVGDLVENPITEAIISTASATATVVICIFGWSAEFSRRIRRI